ncbi:cupredoxin domain-containing protein [Pseudomonas sp.]|uniref:cupredoxin domain-containing protein n=1 Tax=Pseudomonas sp. TaxID=306 RepID=UPI00257E5620|nr:cupredoxin domain-containing protein [Pseudomonas sp.]
MKFKRLINSSVITTCALLSVAASSAFAQDSAYELTVKNHQFSPAPLTIPADTKVKITLTNQDTTTAEFISDDFKGGKLAKGGKTVNFFIGPLKAGTYSFYDEYHEAASNTQLIVQ